MNVAILQPNFFPWLGYFEQIDKVDIFIFLDDVVFGTKPKRMNRNIICDSFEKKKNLTLSLHSPTVNRKIKDCKIIRNNHFKSHREIIYHSYKDAPFYQMIMPLVEEIYSFTNDSVSEFNIHLVKKICKIIGVNAKFLKSSNDFSIRYVNAEEYLLNILKDIKAKNYYAPKTGIELKLFDVSYFKKKKINVYKQNYKPVIYNRTNFIPNLSILDLLFHDFENALQVIRSGRNWEKM